MLITLLPMNGKLLALLELLEMVGETKYADSVKRSYAFDSMDAYC